MAEPNQVIVVWNVRGINNPAKRDAIKNLILYSGASVVCLQETKVQDMNLGLGQQCLGPVFDNFFYVSAVGTRGGVLLACNSSNVQMSNSHVTQNTVTSWIAYGEHGWWFTGVHGPQEEASKVEFIQELREVRELHAGPWMVAGDFNLIKDPTEKSNDRINRRMMGRFR